MVSSGKVGAAGLAAEDIVGEGDGVIATGRAYEPVPVVVGEEPGTLGGEVAVGVIGELHTVTNHLLPAYSLSQCA